MTNKFQDAAMAATRQQANAIRRAKQSRGDYIRKNVYLCDNCGGGWVSADIDEGVTPFMDLCPICETGMGSSLFYRVPQEILDKKPARVEWRKPTGRELRKAGPGVRHHYEQGGLKRVLVDPAPGKRTPKAT